MSCSARVLLCTCPPDAAAGIAEELLKRNLAACVNALEGVASRYRWKGALECEQETLLLIKTEAARVAEVIAALAELHPYEVPELLSLAVDEGNAPYLAWLTASVAASPRTAPIPPSSPGAP